MAEEQAGLESVNKGISRRQLLTQLRALVLTTTLGSFLSPGKKADAKEPEIELPNTLPNKENKEAFKPESAAGTKATMTNLSFIPEGKDFHHTDYETLSCVLGPNSFSRDPDNLSRLNLGNPDNPKSLYQYWQGVKEAIGRGQKVFIAVDLPGETDTDITVADWQEYMTAVSKEFNGAHFIIGNEVNISKRWKTQLDDYADFYLTSAQAIRKHGPESKILVYGEAYDGDGTILREALKKISLRVYKDGGELKDVIDGLSFHFYDTAGKLEKRVELYQQIANDYKINPKLYLTELGKLESARLTENQRADLITQNLACALALAEQGKLDTAIWHTAYAIDDPGNHGLAELNDLGQVVGFKKGFRTFWKIGQRLQKSVQLEHQGDATIIHGEDKQGNLTYIIWSHKILPGDKKTALSADESFNPPAEVNINSVSDLAAALPPSQTSGVEGPPLVISFKKTGNQPSLPQNSDKSFI
jgi:hypothetical protein